MPGVFIYKKMINKKKIEINKKIEKKLSYWKDPQTINLLKNSIRNDLICITSTDTILGFIANLTHPSFEKLNDIKGQKTDRPYLILISSKEELSHFVTTQSLNPQIHNLIDGCWPSPVTIIFKAKENLPSFLTSKEGKIALRCPNHKYLQKLLKSFDGLFSTSANKSLDPPPANINQINPQIIQEIKYLVVDKINGLSVDRKQPILQSLPSTIINVSSGKNVKVIRKGAYPIEELEKHYGSKFKRSEG